MTKQTFRIIQNSQKSMPCNIEAEQAVIGSILTSNDIYDEISQILDKQKFFDPIHAKIFETVGNFCSCRTLGIKPVCHGDQASCGIGQGDRRPRLSVRCSAGRYHRRQRVHLHP